MKTEADRFFQMRVDEKFVAAIDELRVLERPIPSRAELLRRLVFEKVAAAKNLRHK